MEKVSRAMVNERRKVDKKNCGVLLFCVNLFSYGTTKWTFAAPPTSVNRYLNVKEVTMRKKRVKVPK